MRTPSVADQFYPGSPQLLAETVESLLATSMTKNKTEAIAVVAPHAGYIYSGQLAAETLGSVFIPEHIILLGPNHRGTGAQVALSSVSWEMVLGEVPIAKDLTKLLADQTDIYTIDEKAHQLEHSLEVQLPFLQVLQPSLQFTPIVISHISYTKCEEVAVSLAAAIKDYPKKVLIVVSSDMNHYESRKTGAKKDSLALEAISEFSPYKLYQTVHQNRISMCGVLPVVIALLTSQILEAKDVEIIGYTDSGHVSGDTDQVVGYAGICIS